jgi:hypothetical protein
VSYKRCSNLDWIFLALYVLTTLGMIAFSVTWAYREADLKEKHGNINVHPKDLVYNKKVIC